MNDYPSGILTDSPARARPPGPRLRRALTLSLGTHAAAFVVLVFLSNDRTTSLMEAGPPRAEIALAWVRTSGPDGGIGGGGQQTTAPAHAAAAAARVPRTVQPVPDPQQLPAVSVPAALQAATAGLDQLAGLLQPVAVAQPDSRGPGSDTGAGGGPGSGVGPAGGAEIGGGEPGGIGDGPGGTGGSTSPQLLVRVPPQYTGEAMHAKVQGLVLLEALVLTNGTVGDIRIVRSLDPVFGLDQQAIRAVKQWRFAPGTRRGQAIPMLVTIELTFTLR